MNQDLFKQVRNTMISNLQNAMRTIRGFMHMSAGHFGSLVGISADEITQLEEQQVDMTEQQYVALCALIDYKMQHNDRFCESVKRILQLEENSLLERWFLFFDEEIEENSILKDGQELNVEACKTIAKDYKIWIHYDSLKFCKNNKTFQILLTELKAVNEKIGVPRCVLNKLQDDMLSYNMKVGSEARSALTMLNRLKGNQAIVIQEDVSIGTVEERIRQLFCNSKRNFPAVLITENEQLAKDLQTLNEMMDGFDIKVITMRGNTMKLYRNLLVEETSSDEKQTGWDL